MENQQTGRCRGIENFRREVRQPTRSDALECGLLGRELPRAGPHRPAGSGHCFSRRIRRDPHRGCCRRISAAAASTGQAGNAADANDQPPRPAAHSNSGPSTGAPSPMHPDAGSHFRDIRTRPPRRRAQGAEPTTCRRSVGRHVSHISRRRTGMSGAMSGATG